MYRLQSPQAPIARTARYDEYAMDDYPSGTNMIVAVLAYTGACTNPRTRNFPATVGPRRWRRHTPLPHTDARGRCPLPCYGKYAMVEYPSGTNMVVAVLAYTNARQNPETPETLSLHSLPCPTL